MGLIEVFAVVVSVGFGYLFFRLAKWKIWILRLICKKYGRDGKI